MTATVLLVMGVAGAGKSTLGRALAARLGWAFQEGDDLHPEANVAKMRAGIPLSDADRAPWLAAIGRLLDRWAAERRPGVVACSGLKRGYRDQLCDMRPQVRIVFLAADESLVRDRVAQRTDHYYPASLVPSQFATLEPPAQDEHAIEIKAEWPTETQVDAVLAAL